MGAEAVNAKNRPPQRPQNITLTDRAKLCISGVEEVLSFDEERIVMRTTLGELAAATMLLRRRKSASSPWAAQGCTSAASAWRRGSWPSRGW